MCRETSARVGPFAVLCCAIALPSAATAGAAASACSTLLLVRVETPFSLFARIFLGVRIGQLVLGDAQRPLDGLGHQLAELRIVPDLLEMADRLIEDPALAVVLRPDDREIAVAALRELLLGHARRVEPQDHLGVVAREVLLHHGELVLVRELLRERRGTWEGRRLPNQRER